MRIDLRHRGLSSSLPRRLRWTRARIPTRRHVPVPYRPEGRAIVRPSARVSLLHLVATAVVVAVAWGVGTLLQAAYAGRIYPHVTIDRIPVGGMTRAEALAALSYSEAARVNSPIFVQVGGKSWQATPAQFGARYNINDAVDRALSLAHGGPFILGGWDELQTIWHGANLPLSGSHDQKAVMRFLSGLARAVHVAPRAAAVGVRDGDVTITRHATFGQQLDLAGAAAALGAVVNTHDATAVTLPVQPVESALGDDEAEAAVSRAHQLLAAPVTFQWTATSPQSWVLTRNDMLRLLTFTPRCTVSGCRFDMGINARKLSEAFDRGGVSARVNSLPIPAYYLLWLTGDPRTSRVQVEKDTDGTAINVFQAAADVLQGQRLIFLPTRPLHARFDYAAASALNFTQDVGYGAARYAGLDWARWDNLDTASSIISNTIVLPGKTFTLAGHLGPLTRKSGFRPGQNQIGPKDITGVNGGADLMAAAVLAAAYDAGLPIERRVHYPYLNGYTSPGLDAVVTYGKGAPDLVFRNTTNHPILLMTSIDGIGEVSVYLFNSPGNAPGHVSGAYVSATAPPRVTLNPDDSVDTAIGRTVSANGHVTHDQLSSHYAPIDP